MGIRCADPVDHGRQLWRAIVIRTRAAAVAATLATVASLAACSSGGSGGGSVSQSQLEAKLKKEPSIAQLTKSGGQKAAVVNKLVDCAAKALIKAYLNHQKVCLRSVAAPDRQR